MESVNPSANNERGEHDWILGVPMGDNMRYFVFVAPETEPAAVGSRYRDERALIASGLLGSYRRQLGWDKGSEPTARHDASFRILSEMSRPPAPVR